MNINILLIGLGITALGSCSSAYQTAQTPDDLYYTAPKEVAGASRGGGNDEYMAVDNGRDKYSPNRQDSYNPDEYDTYRNDRWLRMSIGNPYYLSTFNNYYWNDWGYSGVYGGFNHGFNNYYGYDNLGFGAGFGYMNSWNNPWGNSIYWNSFYNPYAFNYNPYGYNYIGIVPNSKAPVYRTNSARPTVFNPRAYGNNNTRAANVNTSRSYYNPRTGSYSNYNNTNSASGSRITTGTNGNRRSNSTYYNTNTTRQNSGSYTPPSSNNSGRPERTYTPPPSSNNSSSYPSGGGGGGNGGGGARRPSRN